MSSSSGPQPRGRRLVRGVWLAVAALNLVLFVVAVPYFHERLQTPCLNVTCLHGQLSGTALANLTGLGVSLPAYAAAVLLMHVVTSLIALAVAVVIFWRRPTD